MGEWSADSGSRSGEERSVGGFPGVRPVWNTVKKIARCIRKAELSDVEAMAELERICFETDRVSARQFRYLIQRGRASVLVAEHGGRLVGTAITLFRKNAAQARLYSIAVRATVRGGGYGGALLRTAEEAARTLGCVYMRSEIRADNTASLAFFNSFGYRPFGLFKDFYEDHADALRFEKRLIQRPVGQGARIPYVRQTLDFTCGSAALMMAMKTFQPGFSADRRTELRLWREATTIFMTSGHGGCGPYGLALAAWGRGFSAAVWVSKESGLFVDTVRSAEKKEVIQLVEDDFRQEIHSTGIQMHRGRLTAGVITEALRNGEVPLVLVSSYRMYEENIPHWIVVTGADSSFIYIHDPYVDEPRGKTAADCMDMPIARLEFERMARYGRSGGQAAVFIGRRKRGRKRGV